MKYQVHNLQSPRSGKPVANQFVIEIYDNNNLLIDEVFQSYNSVIAIKHWQGEKSYTVLDKHYWDYSVTTGKYRNLFLSENKAETQSKIDNGTYQLKDLN